MKIIVAWVLAGCISTVALADEAGVVPELSAAQIVEKNVAARGGLEAWRKIQTMVWLGHIERTSVGTPSLPFVLEQKRPNKTRFEIKVQNQMGLRTFDGAYGWKLRPTSSGMPELQPYTAEELSFARDSEGIDGPLMDYQAKGVAVTLEGVDEVEGHKAYRLNVRLTSGASQHVWIDAQTFLEIKHDRPGRSGTISVFYRNYQPIEGLQIPLTIESGSESTKAMDKMVIDKISLNPPLEDQLFAKPNVPGRRNGVLIDATSPQPVNRASSLPAGIRSLSTRSMSDSRGDP